MYVLCSDVIVIKEKRKKISVFIAVQKAKNFDRKGCISAMVKINLIRYMSRVCCSHFESKDFQSNLDYELLGNPEQRQIVKLEPSAI